MTSQYITAQLSLVTVTAIDVCSAVHGLLSDYNLADTWTIIITLSAVSPHFPSWQLHLGSKIHCPTRPLYSLSLTPPYCFTLYFLTLFPYLFTLVATKNNDRALATKLCDELNSLSTLRFDPTNPENTITSQEFDVEEWYYQARIRVYGIIAAWARGLLPSVLGTPAVLSVWFDLAWPCPVCDHIVPFNPVLFNGTSPHLTWLDLNWPTACVSNRVMSAMSCHVMYLLLPVCRLRDSRHIHFLGVSSLSLSIFLYPHWTLKYLYFKRLFSTANYFEYWA